MMGDMSRRKFTLFHQKFAGGLGGKDSNGTKVQSFKTRNEIGRSVESTCA
jgi:hypothetical protein